MYSTNAMDSFFFPSSPVFTGHQQMMQQCGEHGGSSADLMSMTDDTDLLFLAPEAHMGKMYQQPMQHVDSSAVYAMPSNGRHVSEYDWAQLDAPIPVADVQQIDYSSDSVRSGEVSGHSTPTFVPSPTPSQQHQHEEVTVIVPQQQQQQQQQLQHIPLVQTAPTVQHRAPSLLEQFSCTIPDVMCTTTNDRTIVKVKRGATKRAGVTTKKAPSIVVTTPRVEKPLPVFVSASSTASNSSSPMSHPTSSAHVSSATGYTSDDSSPSSLHSHSPTREDDSENNEPSLGDDEDTKRRKLSRKAELARLARKRKKTRLGDLEAEVARLEEELARAKRGCVQRTPMSNAPTNAADDESVAKMDQAVSHMIHAVHTGVVARTAHDQNQRSSSLTGSDAVSRASPTALTPLIDEYMVAYNATQIDCAKHFEVMQQHHLKPMRTFEFLAWLMKQPHESSSSIWSSLLGRELKLNPLSREFRELECFRTSIASQHNFDGEIERTFAKMVQLFTKRATQHSKNLNRIRSILDESQFVSMIEWMNRDKQPQVKMEEM